MQELLFHILLIHFCAGIEDTSSFIYYFKGKRQTRESLPWRKGLFVGSALPQRCLEPSPHLPPQGLDEKRIQQLLCFTCCKNTPQKTQSVPPTHACSSLNYLTPHYIIATGCMPDNAWLLSNCLSVLLSSFLQNFFYYYFLLFSTTMSCIAYWSTCLTPPVDSLSFIYATAHLVNANREADGRV